MRIEIDPYSGFCFGVQRTSQAAEEALNKGRPVNILGEMVHNPEEIKRLESLGVQTVSKEQLYSLGNQTLIIRAHGEPPETFDAISSAEIHFIDGTCPIVKALQKKIQLARKANPELQIVIFGKEKHPEVIGLNGGIDYTGIVVADENADLSRIDFHRPIALFSQTTQDEQSFHRLSERLKSHVKKAGMPTAENFQEHNTICPQVSRRAPALRQFAASVDVMVFVSGANSSNGKYLYGICLEVNPNSHKIQNEKELSRLWFENCQSIGISGATSTPKWQLERLRSTISAMVELTRQS